MAVYVTADWHFNHHRILDLERGQFKTIKEHNDFIINRFNEKVNPEDTVFVLGDVGFYDVENLMPLIKRMNGKLILIRGNHDTFTDEEALEMGFAEVYNHPVYFNSFLILSHEPVWEAYHNPYVMNIHGHLHNSVLNQDNFFNVNVARTYYRPVKIDNYIRKGEKHCKSRRERFTKEWYYSDYLFDPK